DADRLSLLLVDVADDVADVFLFFLLIGQEGVVVGVVAFDGLVVFTTLDLDGAAVGRFVIGLLEADQLGVLLGGDLDFFFLARRLGGGRLGAGLGGAHRGHHGKDGAAFRANDRATIEVVIFRPAVRANAFRAEFRFRHVGPHLRR